MSYLLFADSQGEARVSGRDMALIHQYVKGFSLGLLPPQMLGHLASGIELDTDWERRFRLWWSAGASSQFYWNHARLDPWTVDLNTMNAAGGKVLGMIAWISAQAEVHGYAEGPERQHLAALIERALSAGMLRRDTFGYDGWDAVRKLLEERDDEPIVLSYSVTDQFPDPHPEWDEDDWWALMPETRWFNGIERLRAGEGNVGALVIDDLPSRRYGHGLTIFDVMTPGK